MTAEKKGDLQTTLRAFPGEQKLLPTCISPGVAITDTHSHGHLLPGQSPEGWLPPPSSSLAFPPPLISFGFSPLIKLLACRYV